MDNKWMVARVRAGREEAFCEELKKKNVATYSPCSLELRRVRGKRRETEVRKPIYAGYVFVSFCAGVFDSLSINQDYFGCLKDSSGPSLVPDYIINNLRVFVDKNLADRRKVEKPEFLAGELLRIVSGSFEGQEAKFVRMKNNNYAVCYSEKYKTEIFISPFLLVKYQE